MNNETRRSKIYSYFYGAGTVFQQFLIAVGIMFIILGPVAEQASYAKVERVREEYNELSDQADAFEDEYREIYYDNYNKLNVDMGEEATVTQNDRFANEKNAYNKALKEYKEADEKATKAYEDYENMRYSDSAGEVLLPLFGAVIIIAGVIWSIKKKISFNSKSCEQAYDEEIMIKVSEARTKALTKLNIVAEQIDKVEPVILHGIAEYDPSANKNPIGRLAALFQGILKLFSLVDVILIGAVGAAIYAGIAMMFAEMGLFIVAVIGAFVISAVIGLKLYKKYEKESYVSPKKIKKLEKMYPTLLFRFGSDDRIRVSLPAITVYMFGEEQLYMYYQYFDVVTGKIFCEGIQEYFYEDIVAVTSSQETKKVFKRTGFLRLFIKAIDYLKESITVVSSGCQHSESYIVPMGYSLLDTSFVGMRNLIRQKKSGNE
ncbi:MAG: hypothetical protein IIX16_03135 [Clostridia bacterium]|nr:hypothetical protein [Clostridia bacterium]